MSSFRQLIVGLVAEGPTDYRFLVNVIRRTYEELAFECAGDVEIFEIQEIYLKKTNVRDYFIEAARMAHEKYGVMVLCVHKDADSASDNATFTDQIIPGTNAINASDAEICRNVVPIVPIRETEAWMLADPDSFKAEIGGGEKSDSELRIHTNPESITDPKQRITDAIRIVFDSLPKKRRTLERAELYQPLGQKVSMESLSRLSSYQKFRAGARKSLVKLNYLVE